MKRFFRSFPLGLFLILIFYLPARAQNNAPVLDSIGPQSVDEGQVLTFRIHATDADGDSIVLNATNIPANVTFTDSGNGAASFTFSPDYTQSNIYNITFIAIDIAGSADSEVVAITVNNVNNAPVLDSIGAKSVNEGQVLSFRIHSTDINGDSLILSALNVPTNGVFTDSGNGAGSFTFSPDYTQANIYNVTFIAIDTAGSADSEVVQITVNNVNNTPVLDSIGPKSVTEGQVLTFRAHSTDINGDSLILSALNIPTNATFADSGNGAGAFTFSPDYTQANIYNVTFITTDTVGSADSEVVAITVVSAGNQTPVLDSIGSRSVNEGANLTFRVHSTDADGDSIILSATSVPTNATFIDRGNGAGSFSFNPGYTQAGIFNVTFKATDLSSAVDSEVVQITVNNVNNAPVLDSIGARSVNEGQVLSFRVHSTDINGDSLILSALNIPTNATFADSGNGAGSFTFSPDYTQANIYNVTFISTDTVGAADSEVVQITVVSAGNQTPVLDSIGSRSVNEGANLTFRVHSTDADGDSIILSATSVPTNATFIDRGNGAGSFSFNPGYTQAGIFNVTFKATDLSSAVDSEVVAITVNNVNNAPVLDSIGAKSVNEGQVLSFRVHSTDINGDSLILSALNVPTNGVFTDSGNGAGSFTFSPDYTQANIYNVTFISTDTVGAADSEVVQITVVSAGNQTPVLDSIGSRSVNEGANLTFRVHSTDADGDSIILSATSVPTNATFIDRGNGAGSFSFNPGYTQAGIFNVTFKATDLSSAVDSEVVAITVNNVNNAPVLDSIGAKSVNEGQVLSFRVHSTDINGDSLILSALNVPTNGVFTDSGNGAGSYSFSPDYTQANIYNVTFITTDTAGSADSEVVQIAVNNVNNAPVLDSIGARSVNEGQVLSFRIHSSDINGDSLILSALNVPANGVFTDSGNGSGSFTFSPDYTQANLYNVTFIAIDTVGSADSEVVQITVNNVNNVPVLDSIGARSVNEGQVLTFRVHATDINGDSLILSALNVPTNASFIDSTNGSGSFTFSPDYTQANIYNVTFISTDTVGVADSEVVAITVLSAGNQTPVLDPIGSRNVNEGSNLIFRVHATDADGDAITLTATNLPANSSFADSGNGAGSFTFNPNYTQAGTHNITFKATDLSSAVDSEVVQITVNNVNNPPVLDPIGQRSVNEGQVLAFRVHGTDINGDRLILSALNVPTNATFTDSGNGSGAFSFSPNYTQSGIFNVTFIARDTVGSADSEVVVITVNNVNQAPILTYIGPRSVMEGDTLLFRVSTTDPDGTIPTLSTVNRPTNSSFVDSANGAGSFRFTPDTTQYGIYFVTFISSDGYLADSEIVQITVTEIGNHAPVLDSIGPRLVREGDSLGITVRATDPDGEIPVLGASNLPLNSTFTDNHNGTGLFIFKPSYYQAGVDTVTFIATDTGNVSDYENVVITIIDVNRSPTIDSIPPQNVAVGDSLRIRVVGRDSSDWNGGSLYMTSTNLPLNSTFQDSGSGIGKFRFIPNSSQVGVDTVTFMCTDAEIPAMTGVRNVTITVTSGPNKPPVLNPIGWKIVNEAETLTFNVSASDPDGSIPILYTNTLPRNAVFVDSGNGRGTFTFIPDYAQQGLKQVTFYASDGSLIDYENVLIQVIDAGNQRPILQAIPPDSVMEGDTLIILVHADDPDSTISSLSTGTLPLNAVFSDSGNGYGVLIFTPVYVQSGVYGIMFIASDGSLADTETVLITVLEAGNQPSVLSVPYDSVTVNEDDTLSFTITGVDPDSIPPILRATNLPTNATFDTTTSGKVRRGTFSFSPDYFQAGNYTVYFQVLDSEDTLMTSVDSVKITVINVNRKPQFTQCVSSTIVYEGNTLVINIKATDNDGPIPRLDVEPHLTNSVFVDSGNGTGTLIFTPYYNQGNQNPTVYPITFMAIDSEYPSDIGYCLPPTTLILVFNVPMPPIISPINDTSIVEGNTLRIVVRSSDPDSIPPALAIINRPNNSSFISAGFDGLFTFTPAYTQSGVYNVSFIATDATALADTEQVQITVIEAGNQRPVLTHIPDTIAVVSGSQRRDTLILNVSATDPDGTIPHLYAENLPANATFIDSLNGRGRFVFVPDSVQVDSIYDVTFIASDDTLSDSLTVTITVVPYVRGDANGDGKCSLADVVYLINYLFKGGPAPNPRQAGDANRDKKVTVGDCVYLINYLFKSGPPP
jgi:spore coat protein CotF